jgi:hypothetical protein
MLRPPEFCRTVAALQAERHDDLDDDPLDCRHIANRHTAKLIRLT